MEEGKRKNSALEIQLFAATEATRPGHFDFRYVIDASCLDWGRTCKSQIKQRKPGQGLLTPAAVIHNELQGALVMRTVKFLDSDAVNC